MIKTDRFKRIILIIQQLHPDLYSIMQSVNSLKHILQIIPSLNQLFMIKQEAVSDFKAGIFIFAK